AKGIEYSEVRGRRRSSRHHGRLRTSHTPPTRAGVDMLSRAQGPTVEPPAPDVSDSGLDMRRTLPSPSHGCRPIFRARGTARARDRPTERTEPIRTPARQT